MASSIKMTKVEPTVFFVHKGKALRNLVRVSIDNNGGTKKKAALLVRGQGVNESVSLGLVKPGQTEHEVFLPDIRKPIPIEFSLKSDGAVQHTKTVNWQPQRHWSISLVMSSHHDLGYTDLPSNLLIEHDGFMDQLIDFCEQTKNWPEDSKFRYLCEQAWSLVHYFEHRPKKVVDRFVKFLKNGQMEITALWGNQTTEICGHEEMVRLLYPSFKLRRDHGIKITTAQHNDIPGFSWGLISVLAQAGIEYLSMAVPSWYFGGGPNRVHPCWGEKEVLRMDMPGAFWWQGPDGKRVLVWYVYGIGATSYEHTRLNLPENLRFLEENGYAYDEVCYNMGGGGRDNAPPTMLHAELAREWNKHWVYPKLMTSTNQRFLSGFKKRWGHTLKTVRGEMPNTDYTVAATCTPQETGIDRNTHEELVTAEKLATIASMVSDYEYPKAVIDDAYRNTFNYDLHCWGMADIGGPAHDGCYSEKGGFAFKASALAHDIIIKASNKITDNIKYPEDGYYVTVFNSLSWSRDDVVRVPMCEWDPCGRPMYWQKPASKDEGPTMVCGCAVGRGTIKPPEELFKQGFDLVDTSSGEKMTYQLSVVNDPQAAQPWAAESVAISKVTPAYGKSIVFVAKDLPAVGYKTYQIVPKQEKSALAGSGHASAELIENDFFKVAVDTASGKIRSIFDKELGRELVDGRAPHNFGEIIARSSETGKEDVGKVTNVSVSESGPVFTTLRFKGEVMGCPRWTKELTLYHGLKRIDVNARLLRDSTPTMELYFAFPFQVDNPQFRFEASNSVIEPTKDQLPNSCTDYYAMQHWANVFNNEHGVAWSPIDAPMAEFGGLWPGYVSGAHHGLRGPGYGHPFIKPGGLKKSHIYSLIMYSNFRTNFLNAHPGEILIRYAFSSHRGTGQDGTAHTFGWNVSNPPVTVWMHVRPEDSVSEGKGPQQGKLSMTASFCQVSASNVTLLTLKQAEDGRGVIARCIETQGKPVQAKLTLPHLNIKKAYETNGVEENQKALTSAKHAVSIKLQPYEIRTVRLIV